ncbi:unnamed protein product [Miscanthus lutarioriparius]|uniref:Uncharacterized protein n=1 Tax=Miscanthus lutarioriparius TaxID=422564 RepID=A0A811QH39_9POAL|nr:unnamed protein product [Miscanthus lutarioriparius]
MHLLMDGEHHSSIVRSPPRFPSLQKHSPGAKSGEQPRQEIKYRVSDDLIPRTRTCSSPTTPAPPSTPRPGPSAAAPSTSATSSAATTSPCSGGSSSPTAPCPGACTMLSPPDCLFKNPLFDQQAVLKIWNLNKFGGVNCQGAGWDPVEHRVRGYSHCYKPVSGNVQPADVEWGQREDTSAMVKAASYAVYRCQTEEFLLMTPGSEPIQFTLQPSSFELFTFAPVTTIVGGAAKACFAPIGLVDLLNCGGAIVDVEHSSGSEVRVKVKGGGRLLVYSDVEPKKSLWMAVRLNLNGKMAGSCWSM